MYQLFGVFKHYQWGGKDYLPHLFDISNPENEPYAEYWIGSHESGDASIHNLTPESFRAFVQTYPGKIFPPDYSSEKTSGLPYLFKILDVKDMLSIQVHPDKITAEKGFAKEESEGKERSAYDRVYKDDNHKPELMVALSDFYLVQGFKPQDEIRKTLQKTPELERLTEHLDNGGVDGLYRHIMTMDQSEVNDLLKPLGKRIKPLYEQDQLSKSHIDFWAARAFLTFNRKGVCDRGILSLYLMNLVFLKKGEGIYQAPGVIHAYMEGQNVECMANSDNVVRGGLTAKHMDIDLLLEITNFKPEPPRIITPHADKHKLLHYETPADEFDLSVLSNKHSTILPTGRSYLLCCIDGLYEITSDNGVTSVKPGDSFLILTDDKASVIPLEKEGQLFVAEIGRAL